MAENNLATVLVMLCDWRGFVVWNSQPTSSTKIGDLAWAHLSKESQERAKELFAQVATLRESQSLLVSAEDGRHFRCWLWPLDTPEVAVCALCREVPAELTELTDRERECMQLLAQGLPTREIAEQLEISTSTLHAHLTNVREKLKLDSFEAVISFAARFCYPLSKPLADERTT